MQTQDSTDRHRAPITLVLVDDERIIRGALTQSLTSAGFDIVAEAANAQDAVRLVVDLRPDVVLMDLRLPDRGREDSRADHSVGSRLAVLILTRTEQNRIVEAIVAGASGYILKTATPEEIIDAVKATAGGESVISSQVAGKLLQRIREREHAGHRHQRQRRECNPRRPNPARGGDFRAARQRNEQPGHRGRTLASRNTIHNHVASILSKLHLDNRIQAAVQAVRSGIS